MTALVGVRGGAAPVLDQELAQPPAGAVEVRCLGVERGEDVIVGDAVVEGVDEGVEEGIATRSLVQRGASGVVAQSEGSNRR